MQQQRCCLRCVQWDFLTKQMSRLGDVLQQGCGSAAAMLQMQRGHLQSCRQKIAGLQAACKAYH